MRVQSFIAASPAEAVHLVQQALGPEAVILGLRQLEAPGLARLWQKPRIEIVAGLPALPDQQSEETPMTESDNFPGPGGRGQRLASDYGNWRSGQIMERSGLLPELVFRVLDHARKVSEDSPPGSLGEEFAAVRAAMLKLWPAAKPAVSNIHVFIGPPGSGKTTVLCKWLARAVLVENRPCRVWRLDSEAANTAGFLSVFAETLGVPVDRCRMKQAPLDPADLVLVDLPGTPVHGCESLRQQIENLVGPQPVECHLVLNAAYDCRLLLRQARIFQQVPCVDIILTHVDEEPAWTIVWNLALGTNCRVSSLSAGQNLPGLLESIDPAAIIDRYLPQKQEVQA